MNNLLLRMAGIGCLTVLMACAHQKTIPEKAITWQLPQASSLNDDELTPELYSRLVEAKLPPAEETAKTDLKSKAVIKTEAAIDKEVKIRGNAKEAEVKPLNLAKSLPVKMDPRRTIASQKPSKIKLPRARDIVSDDIPDNLVTDIPVAYNSKVQYWISYYQTAGRPWFTKWLERSTRYLPVLKRTLRQHGMPQDLAYLAMIESGFSFRAQSTAQAVGPWQFIRETGKRYGLKVNWWLDERRDFQKSTDAAARYMKRMYGMFHNWYLVAAGYNTGENRIKRVIKNHGTKNFWKISQKNGGLEDETKDYVPKFIAALIVAKSPKLYGFQNINYSNPLNFEHFRVPGGTHLDHLAAAIGVSPREIEELNPELVLGYVPTHVEGHLIRIPKGKHSEVSRFIRRKLVSQN